MSSDINNTEIEVVEESSQILVSSEKELEIDALINPDAVQEVDDEVSQELEENQSQLVSPLEMPDKPKIDTKFDKVLINIATPDTVRSWSSGELKNPETINYRTFKPESGGLFCQRIFGPVKDWECACGKYKRIKYRGIVCDRCGVEVSQSKIRRDRMGHIELAAPVAHIWFFKTMPSRIGAILDLTIRALERIIYFENYVVIDPGETDLKRLQVINADQFDEYYTKYGNSFEVGMGAEAIYKLLESTDLDAIAEELYDKMQKTKSKQIRRKIAKRLKIIEGFRQSTSKPENMILQVIPVIPPDLRPLVPLEGGRFATSDLNDLYRRVINRNNRLKLLLGQRTPDVIIRNEKRMLQESVDALIDNGRHGRVVTGPSGRQLKSISDNLKGKQGRFRQNLLGKRVDYSGRSVIVVGPELKINQCGLPKKMALQLFEPFIIRELKADGRITTVRAGKKMIERAETEVWDILDYVTKDHAVLLNRAPTLHRLGIQAFEPVLIEGNAIRVHPLVCAAFNADFDGDQMAVHVPLSKEALWETKNLIMSTNNIFSPASGKPIMAPTQDMVLGIYYLTIGPWLKEHTKKITGVLASDEVQRALDSDVISIHSEIKVLFPNEKEPIITTAGRVIFNENLPDGLPYYNETINKKKLGNVVMDCYKIVGRDATVEMLDKIKALGFHEATVAGISISMSDMAIPVSKKKRINTAYNDVAKVTTHYEKGVITENERYNRIVDIWTHTTDQLANDLFDELKLPNLKDKELNPVHMMVDSGARGSKNQIRQLAAMRGLMAKPSGEIIETPIISNFKEGLTVLEYFISTHGARKGLADTALKTADAGYLTRRLVDVSQDVIVSEPDCGTPNGITVSSIKEGNETVIKLSERITGRVSLNDIYEPGTNNKILSAGELISSEAAETLDNYEIDSITIRSPLTCEAVVGICSKCYGMDLGRQQLVEKGTPAGIIAAQSIGEPGTQLTMRTFHIGGTASAEVSKPFHKADHSGKVIFHDVRTVETIEGTRALNKNGFISLLDKKGKELAKYPLVIGALITVNDGDFVKKGDTFVSWDPYSVSIYSESDGKVEYHEIIDGVTMTKQTNEVTGQIETVILDSRENLHPQIILKKPENDEYIGYYPIPANAHIVVGDNEIIKAGDLIAKTPRKASMTKDITGGLPRVGELFEARKPKEPAEIAKIDGVIEFAEGLVRGHRKILVTNETTGDEVEHLVPMGRHLIVTRGELVRKGQQLTEGAINPQDLLAVCGVRETQKYLLDQIQEVYRFQGVEINDKHVEVIVRQMLHKVQITDPGDTRFLFDEVIEQRSFKAENEKMSQLNPPGRPASATPVLQGITKAGLSTSSFISAASFQETTRVLTEAAATSRVDHLIGFKENIIMGHVVPSGTGFSRNRLFKGTEEELYMGRTLDSHASILSANDEDDVTGDGYNAMNDVENIIQGVNPIKEEPE